MINCLSCLGSDNWKKANVTLAGYAPHDYIVDKRTGELYWDDSISTVREKCFNYCLALPSVGVASMMWYALRVPVDILRCDSPALKKDIWKVVTTPFFCIAMLFAAFYGVVISPYDGRKWVAWMEKKWHYDISHKMDLRHVMAKKNLLNPIEFFSTIYECEVWYLGYCFQVRGKIIK